ncbi:hypothetical protein E4U12_004733, partial [Claviceps purpurea]
IKTFGQPKKAAAMTPTPPITTPKTPPKIPRIYGFNLNDLDPARKQSILTYATVGAVKDKMGPWGERKERVFNSRKVFEYCFLERFHWQFHWN